MGVQYGSRSTELARLFDCACGVLEYAVDDFESVSGIARHFYFQIIDMKGNRTSSWHVSQEIAEQQRTLDKHITDSQQTALNTSKELSAQTSLIQENSSWAQRLTNLLSGCVADSAHGFGNLVLKSTAAACYLK